ncbi:hypothetical protein Nmel_017862, partial [Mimus melanotis]
HDYSAFEVSWGGLAVAAPSLAPPRTPLSPRRGCPRPSPHSSRVSPLHPSHSCVSPPCPLSPVTHLCPVPVLPPHPAVSPPDPGRPSLLPSPQTEIMRNEFERLAARQPLELLSMKR